MDDWIMANQGQGAFYCRAGAAPQRLSASEQKTLASMAGFSALFLIPQPKREKLAAQNSHFLRVGSLRCSCHEYRMLAQGKVDFIFNATMNPWDHAAGVLIVEEAGGAAACLDGSPYSPTKHNGRFLVANNPDQLAQLIETFAWIDEGD